ncbi:hypothetical protein THAOC_13598 [Thalassiosira oceanica]|uniref:Uncharacterized protein n=1 Tax=Thalassiosira oceanica TaxID=159749 RepID=K0T541_THAOC|nr:hypothetical protein THAOC_13598 [Thalassiosira oceanica]|eukprot:EJK65527.1 hypothetical protein THAOC_13598 [Thalassiosira oceanica]
MDSDTLPGAAAATDAADPIGLAGEHGISESVQYSTTAGPARQTAPVEMARVISAIDRREVPTSSASRNSGKLNSTRVQRSNRSVGKTPFGYIQRCKCGENQCTSQIYWRHAAMGDPDNVIPNFVWIPAMPKKQVTHLQKRKAKFVEMIYKQIGRDLKEATKGMHLSILHWPRDRRQAMIDSSNKINTLNKGVLTVDEHVKLIQQMLDDGSLTESDQFEEGLYWNKPGSIEGAVMELGRMEILYWFDDESLVKKILKSNTSKRPTMPYSDKTLRARLTEDIQIFNKAEADISQGVGGTINVKVPFWVRSTKQDRHKKTGSPGVAVTLNVNDLGSALIPISDDTTIRPAANNRPSPSRKHACILWWSWM